MRKTGIFGGTFNPVHMGHLINSEFIRNTLELDRIFFVPARSPVHKEIQDRVTPADRLNMVKLAIEGNQGFEVSSIEIDRKTPSYTLYTLNQFMSDFPEDIIYLIIGSDSFNELDTWKSYEDILTSVNIAVMKRAGDPNLRKDLLKISRHVDVVENPLIQISSTLIRERVKKGLSIKYLVPDSVNKYIIMQGLYRN